MDSYIRERITGEETITKELMTVGTAIDTTAFGIGISSNKAI